ncbi:MAG: FAD-dependent oxidoreductase, partial [Candidatus Omnitrophica bacterium]|nr:FAD-dependent oxidoreductase [Candidatus Omnitrophota bacterium]
MKAYDLIIIGSGPGGYIAALYASRFKKSVCVMEKAELGGTCLNRGCIPTKAMLHSASLLSTIKGSSEYGIEVSAITVNFPAITARKDLAVARLRAGVETLFKANKIDLMHGDAKLTGANTVTVNGEKYSAKDIIIATGSRPAALSGIPFDEKRIYSSDGIFGLKDIPDSITIVGGGVIGCEFASLFNALGSKVAIVEILDRLLPAQSKDISRKLETIFKKRGIDLRTSTKFEPGSESQKILVAVGRKPNTE